MSILSKIIGSSIAEPIEAIGNVIDKLYTTDGEKLDKEILLERLRQESAMAQAEINKSESQNPSVFVSGWRAYIGWTCGVCFSFHYLFFPYFIFPLATACGISFPVVDTSDLIPLMISLLGIVGHKAFKNFKNKEK